MDTADNYYIVCGFRVNRSAAAHLQFHQRWIPSQRSTGLYCWPLRVGDSSAERVAYCPAYGALFEAGAAEAHCSHSVDGAYICAQCGESLRTRASFLAAGC